MKNQENNYAFIDRAKIYIYLFFWTAHYKIAFRSRKKLMKRVCFRARKNRNRTISTMRIFLNENTRFAIFSVLWSAVSKCDVHKREGFKLDYKRFRIYLKEKYGVIAVYMFMGFLSSNQELYRFLQTCGFIIIFKSILECDDELIKGNCDTDLVLRAMIDFKEYDKAVIVIGDGDFYCL